MPVRSRPSEQWKYTGNFTLLFTDGMHGRKFEDLVAKVHMTFIIGNDQPGKQTDARITEAAMSMGYRFEIREFCVNPGQSASVLIANVGVAPIYRDAYVAVDDEIGSFNLRLSDYGGTLPELRRIFSGIPCRSRSW